MKTGIITGSSRGIGLATIDLLTSTADTKVIGSSTSGNHILNRPNFQCLKLDLSDSNSICEFADNLEGLKLDFIVNNAAILLEDWESSQINLIQLKKTFEVNLFGTIELTEKLLPLLNKNAHIINVTSDWGSFSEQNFDAFQPQYKMSKAALNMYTKLLAKRLEGKDICVSAIDPGWTKTDMGGIAASRRPMDVAQDIFNLLNSDVKTGQFWHKGKIRNW